MGARRAGRGAGQCRPRGPAHGRHGADAAALCPRRLQARQPPPHGAGAPVGRRTGQAGKRHHDVSGHAGPGKHDARRRAAHGRHPGLYQQYRPRGRHRPPRPAQPRGQVAQAGLDFLARAARQP
ncbi:hypothetical protein G6F66_014860 [Rhizopus arrhizus]|nr:hypothetical protein G6F66_014860 [Rhizopus arrhizus]